MIIISSYLEIPPSVLVLEALREIGDTVFIMTKKANTVFPIPYLNRIGMNITTQDAGIMEETAFILSAGEHFPDYKQFQTIIETSQTATAIFATHNNTIVNAAGEDSWTLSIICDNVPASLSFIINHKETTLSRLVRRLSAYSAIEIPNEVKKLI